MNATLPIATKPKPLTHDQLNAVRSLVTRAWQEVARDHQLTPGSPAEDLTAKILGRLAALD